MSVCQWKDPTPEQLQQANEMAARIGQEPYWVGDILCIGQPDPEPEPEPE